MLCEDYDYIWFTVLRVAQPLNNYLWAEWIFLPVFISALFAFTFFSISDNKVRQAWTLGVRYALFCVRSTQPSRRTLCHHSMSQYTRAWSAWRTVSPNPVHAQQAPFQIWYQEVWTVQCSMCCMWNIGYHLFTDNFYTKPVLAQALCTAGTLRTGTVHGNSRGIPVIPSLAVGECIDYRR